MSFFGPGAQAPLVLGLALLADLIVGEPPNWAHPVVWLGALQGLVKRHGPRRPFPGLVVGGLTALLLPALTFTLCALLLRALAAHPILSVLASAALLKSSFAVRGLGGAAAEIAAALRARDLPRARAGLRSLVSRDTRDLDAPLLAAAAVESVAENASDSVVAPLLFFALLGVPGALAYRAANTLDAMIGYRGEFEYLGKVGARLDDLLNLIPARLTAALFVLGAPLCGASALGALRVWWRDGGSTESPNAGRPMAAMAGALGVELEKVGHYRLGAPAAKPAADAIERANRMLWISTAALALALLGLAACLRPVGAR